MRGIHGASNIVGYGEEAHMKAVRIHTLGGPEVLRYEDVPDPRAGVDEVLIKVAAAGVNYADLGRRKGTYARHITLPAILGSEVAGTVEQIGPRLAAWRSSWSAWAVRC